MHISGNSVFPVGEYDLISANECFYLGERDNDIYWPGRPVAISSDEMKQIETFTVIRVDSGYGVYINESWSISPVYNSKSIWYITEGEDYPKLKQETSQMKSNKRLAEEISAIRESQKAQEQNHSNKTEPELETEKPNLFLYLLLGIIVLIIIGAVLFVLNKKRILKLK